jgi:hypothetical protein
MTVTDFKPYNGDLVEIEFSDEQDTQSRRAILVKPLKHCHLNEVVSAGCTCSLFLLLFSLVIIVFCCSGVYYKC